MQLMKNANKAKLASSTETESEHHTNGDANGDTKVARASSPVLMAAGDPDAFESDTEDALPELPSVTKSTSKPTGEVVTRPRSPLIATSPLPAVVRPVRKSKPLKLVDTEAACDDDDDEDDDDYDEGEDEDEDDDSFVNNSHISESNYETSEDEAGDDDEEEDEEEDEDKHSEPPTDWDEEEPNDDEDEEDDEVVHPRAPAAKSTSTPKPKPKPKARQIESDDEDEEEDEDVDEARAAYLRAVEKARQHKLAAKQAKAIDLVAEITHALDANSEDDEPQPLASDSKSETKTKTQSKPAAPKAVDVDESAASTNGVGADKEEEVVSVSNSSVKGKAKRLSKPRRDANHRVTELLDNVAVLMPGVQQFVDQVRDQYPYHTSKLDSILYSLRLSFPVLPDLKKHLGKTPGKHVFAEWLDKLLPLFESSNPVELLVAPARRLTKMLARYCTPSDAVKYGTIAAGCFRFNVPGTNALVDDIEHMLTRLESSSEPASASATATATKSDSKTKSSDTEAETPSRKRKRSHKSPSKPRSSNTSSAASASASAAAAAASPPRPSVSASAAAPVVPVALMQQPEVEIVEPRAKKRLVEVDQKSPLFPFLQAAAPRFRRALVKLSDPNNPARSAYLNSLLATPLTAFSEAEMMAVVLHVLPGLAPMLRNGQDDKCSLDMLQNVLFDNY